MNKFEYVQPQEYKDIREWLDNIKKTDGRDIGDVVCDGTDEERKKCLKLLSEPEEQHRQELAWLLENKDELAFVSCQTEDLGPLWEDMARWYDNDGREVYAESIGTGEPDSLVRYKAALAGIGFDCEWLDGHIHDNGILK